MSEFLLEILSEEIPARMQAKAAEDLRHLVSEGLKANGLSFEAARSYVTPRRLALVIEGLPAATPDRSEEKRGPRVGAPEAALDGFLKSAGLSLEECEQRDTGKGVFYFAVIHKKGRSTIEVLKEVVEAVMADFPWPKSQRWGALSVRWVRPIQSILALFSGQIVPISFGAITAANITQGHRFLAPDLVTVADYADYVSTLRKAYVVLDAAERRHAIVTKAEDLAQARGYRLKSDEGLLAEVTGLVEWPVLLAGGIDDAFMDVPKEVLITSMKSHQKYFSCLKEDGSLAPCFILASNIESMDGGKAIIAGNERVLRARLSDARFFWQTDRKQSLESRLPKLQERLFYAGLGSMFDKVSRLRRLARSLAESMGADPARADRAALLAKADLVTEMVGEFPELQGVMGRYYALNDGESPDIAQALAEHYSPQGPNDLCPTALLSVCVSLADKIDSLAGFFAIDEKPTGSKDPFALRRAALGVIRLVLENGVRLGLGTAFRLALAGYADVLQTNIADRREQCVSDLLAFFADRLKVHLKEQGIRHDLIDAVFALQEDDLVRLLARVEALAQFLTTEDGINLVTAYRRAANILRIEEKKDGVRYDQPVDSAKLDAKEELALIEALARLERMLPEMLVREDFTAAMSLLADLRAPVDAFFDHVTVNAEDAEIRRNRLRLLARIVTLMGAIADFSKIEG